MIYTFHVCEVYNGSRGYFGGFNELQHALFYLGEIKRTKMHAGELRVWNSVRKEYV